MNSDNIHTNAKEGRTTLTQALQQTNGTEIVSETLATKTKSVKSHDQLVAIVADAIRLVSAELESRVTKAAKKITTPKKPACVSLFSSEKFPLASDPKFIEAFKRYVNLHNAGKTGSEIPLGKHRHAASMLVAIMELFGSKTFAQFQMTGEGLGINMTPNTINSHLHNLCRDNLLLRSKKPNGVATRPNARWYQLSGSMAGHIINVQQQQQ